MVVGMEKEVRKDKSLISSFLRNDKNKEVDVISELYNKIFNELLPKVKAQVDKEIFFGGPQEIKLPQNPDPLHYEYFIDVAEKTIGRKLIVSYDDERGLQETGVVEYYKTMESERDKREFIGRVEKAYKELKEVNRNLSEEQFSEEEF